MFAGIFNKLFFIRDKVVSESENPASESDFVCYSNWIINMNYSFIREEVFLN
jgi:hypothetical protein